ncbi:MAG: prepilin peptidase [Bdellovibrionaceae bacterium]|nr:prepilin peptidase [Pseudobdellovibrionaceae bacterium]
MPYETEFFTTVFFLFGAILGSFANVVICRLPQRESVAFPASHCRHCKTPIKWYHNIPIFGWVILRGKCAACGKKFSVRYAIVELVMGLLFAFAYVRTGMDITLAERLIFIFCVVTASVIDLDHMILPDKFTLSGILIGLAGALVNPERGFWDALLGVLVGGGILWLVAYLYWVFREKEGMGGGDIKLLAWIGAVLGLGSIPVVILLSSVVGAVVGLLISLRTKDGLRAAIPFGPYLSGAALAYMLLDGPSWTRWYLALHGLE